MDALQLGDLGFWIFSSRLTQPFDLALRRKIGPNYKLLNCAAHCWRPSVLKLCSNGAPMDALQLGDLRLSIFGTQRPKKKFENVPMEKSVDRICR